jgi:hypothetical protein
MAGLRFYGQPAMVPKVGIDYECRWQRRTWCIGESSRPRAGRLRGRLRQAETRPRDIVLPRRGKRPDTVQGVAALILRDDEARLREHLAEHHAIEGHQDDGSHCRDARARRSQTGCLDRSPFGRSRATHEGASGRGLPRREAGTDEVKPRITVIEEEAGTLHAQLGPLLPVPVHSRSGRHEG